MDANSLPWQPYVWVVLDVGGTVYKTTVDTLTRYDDGGYFMNLVSDKWSEGSNRKVTDAPIRIDRDGHVFRYILQWLRNNRINLPEESARVHEVRDIYDEAKYFCLNSLADVCQRQIRLLERRRHEAEDQFNKLKVAQQQSVLPGVSTKRVVESPHISSRSPPEALCGSERTPLSGRRFVGQHTAAQQTPSNLFDSVTTAESTLCAGGTSSITGPVSPQQTAVSAISVSQFPVSVAGGIIDDITCRGRMSNNAFIELSPISGAGVRANDSGTSTSAVICPAVMRRSFSDDLNGATPIILAAGSSGRLDSFVMNDVCPPPMICEVAENQLGPKVIPHEDECDF